MASRAGIFAVVDDVDADRGLLAHDLLDASLDIVGNLPLIVWRVDRSSLHALDDLARSHQTADVGSQNAVCAPLHAMNRPPGSWSPGPMICWTRTIRRLVAV